MYSYEQVLEASKVYFDGDDLAAKVFADKYALQNLNGEFVELTPDDMHKRLAKELARIELKYPNPLTENEIFNLIKNFKYVVPQGSPMSAIGNPYQLQSLSNCFVIKGIHDSKYDSYGGIMLADQQLAQIFKRRGGCGLDISGIRPKGMRTSNAAKTTDGIGIFMDRFSNTCREVAMNGRRGALMITIDVAHPEIETFINIKRDKARVTGANISIKLTDEFMEAVQNDSEYTLRYPTNSPISEARYTKVVKAKSIWDQIIDSAWTSAEPGLLFWDNVKKTTPADIYKAYGYETISVNPCGELLLSANLDSCRLLCMNLLGFVKNPFTNKAKFDYELFRDYSIKSQRLMDDIIDLELEAVEKIIAKIENDPEDDDVKLVELNLWKDVYKAGFNGRRTGLGITALGDCLAAMNIKYGSNESIDETYKIYREMAIGAYISTTTMAEERGAFPIFSYDLEKDHKYLNEIMDSCPKEVKEKWQKTGRRNIALTTTAPTGSLSILTQTTSGIEPAFLLSYKRRKKINPSDVNTKIDFTDALGDKWQEFDVHHHGLKKWMNVSNKIEINESPYAGATSADIDWIQSIKMQAAAQKSVDHSLSKTVNLPNNVTKELVSEVYMTAWKTGCKGCTIYRDGCRDGVLVSNTENKPKSPSDRPEYIENIMAPKRPVELLCDIRKVKVNGESWTIFVSFLKDKPYEVFGGLSKFVDIPNKYKTGVIKKANGMYNLIIDKNDEELVIKDISSIFENKNYEAITRLISLNLRHGTPIHFLVEQLTKDKYAEINSFTKVVSRVLKSYIKDGIEAGSDKTCEQCKNKNTLIYQEGCLLCKSCGYSKCN